MYIYTEFFFSCPLWNDTSSIDSLEITSDGRIAQALREVYMRTPCRFKITHSFGYILRNMESESLIYGTSLYNIHKNSYKVFHNDNP